MKYVQQKVDTYQIQEQRKKKKNQKSTQNPQ